jgi:hypothetical protein
MNCGFAQYLRMHIEVVISNRQKLLPPNCFLHTGSDIVPALSTPLTFAVETAHLTF